MVEHKRFHPVLLALTVLGLGLAAVLSGAGSATAQEPSDGIGAIVVSHSGQCLGTDGRSTDNLAPIVQQPCDGSSTQTWRTTDLGDGHLTVQLNGTGRCIDIEGGSQLIRARAILFDCHGQSNQQFGFGGGSATTLRSRHSNLCLDVEGASMAPGATVLQYTCHGGANQRFDLDRGPGDGTIGSWSPKQDLPLVPVAASALGNGKVLMWSAYGRDTFSNGRGYTQTVLYDPTTGQSTERQVSNTGHEMFCPGIANLADGRILVNGGSNAAETSIYDPTTDRWQTADDMTIARGYQGTTLLSDGSVFTLGGSWSGGLGNKQGEVWTEGQGWRRLSGVPAEPFTANDPQGVYRGDNHLWLFAWTGDRVFHAGPTRAMHWIDTTGNGSVTGAGNRGNDAYAMNGNAVMYEPGRILTVGGAPAYSNGNATANATVIDITGTQVTSRPVAPMNNRRTLHHSVVLPDGDVVVVGGQTRSELFTDNGAIYAAELWDADTETFRPLASMTVPRTYHSFALLLADGRVMAGGGGLCGTCTTNHPDIEILTPPYLLDDDGQPRPRPTISSAPSSIDLDQRFDVSASAGIAEFSLVRLASSTHSVNNDQRRIPLAFTGSGGSYRLRAPDDGGVAPPGDYFLFAIDGDGVPSVAAVVNLTTDVDPGQPDPATIEGTVDDGSGGPVAGLAVDLFTQNPDGSRGSWLGSASTAADGSYSFEVEPGCYTVTFIAPDGRTFTNDRRWLNASDCLGEGGITTLDATLTVDGGQDDATIEGTVSGQGEGPVAGVPVEVFTQNADGSRGTWLRTEVTGPDGRYRFGVDAGCYTITFVAPTGRTWVETSTTWYNAPDCVSPGQTATLDATLVGQGQDPTRLTGSVTEQGGGPIGGVGVDLFTQNADGSRGTWLRSVATGADGSYHFDVLPGCYTITFIAPPGRTFSQTNSSWYNAPDCVPDGSIVTVDAVLTP